MVHRHVTVPANCRRPERVVPVIIGGFAANNDRQKHPL
jgi:hypothetical protein